MSILIKGMEMPDCGYVCLKVFANGDVMMNKVHRGALVITGIKDKVGTAIPVPAHGRLIDAEALKPYMLNEHYKHRLVYDANEVANAPTIVPAEEATDGV